MAHKSIITFPRVVAVMACGIFALVGSVFFSRSLVGNYEPPPSSHEVRTRLANDGVTTRAEPLFEVPRKQNEKVSLEGRLTHRAVKSGERADIAAAIGVRAWGNEDATRSPIELTLVFDVSGSMQGEPIRNVQTAAASLIDRLSERDRVALVAYSSDAWLVSPLSPVTAENRHNLQRAIRDLKTGGGTNISAGWELGKAQLESEGDSAAVQRVVLLSDGQANEGVTDIETLGRMTSVAMEGGVTTTALGVGLDYNEDLMQRMARSGGGNYYFVHDSTPGRAFDDELAMLTDSVSSRAMLRVSANPPLQVTNIEGFDWRHGPGSSVEIELGSLAAGMRRDALVEFASTNVFEPVTVDVELSWLDESTGNWKKHTWQQVVAAGDENEYDAVVLSRLQKVKTARALHDATLEYQAGNRSHAVEMLESTVAANEAFIDRYDVEEDVFDRANDRLSELAEDIRNYDPNSNRGKFVIKGSKYNSANVAVDSSVTF